MSGDDTQPGTKTTTTNNFGPSKRGMSVESFKVMDVLRRANELESKFRTGEDDGDGDGGGGIGGGGGRGGGGGGICHCEVGQPGSGAPRSVVRAAIEALSGNGNGNENGDVDGRLGYTDAFGLISLRTRISNHYAKKYPCPPRRRPSAAATADDLNDEDDGNGNNEIDIDRIVVTTGSSGGFLLAFTACFDVGDTIAIASSGYPCYRNILSALGCALASVKVNDEFKLTSRELRMEIERRKEMGEEGLRGLILSSPSNPTGAMLSPDELREICELCDEEGIRFLSDEIYHGISYGKEEATALTYSSSAIVINSFSKYYSMSGWRLGWMVLPYDLIDTINVLQQNMFINAPTISQAAALHCWDDDAIQELEGHVAKYRASRERVLRELGNLEGLPSGNVAPADGGFYVYVDLGDDNVCPDARFGSTEMCRRLLEGSGVAFTPGTDFEDPNTNLGDRRFRISYAGGTDTVMRAMGLFVRFWPEWVRLVRDAKNPK